MWREALLPKIHWGQVVQCPVRQAEEDHAEKERHKLPVSRGGGEQAREEQYGQECSPGGVRQPGPQPRDGLPTCREAWSAARRNGTKGKLRMIFESLCHVPLSERKDVRASGGTRAKSRWK